MFTRRAKQIRLIGDPETSVRITGIILSVFLEGVKIFISVTRRWNSQSVSQSECSYIKTLWTVPYQVVVDVLVTASDSKKFGVFLEHRW